MSKNLNLQSWPQVPSIAHFCSLFREAFNLFEFDIQDLEESLLLFGSEEDYDQLVLHLLVRLLQGCLPYHRKRINRENYNTYLRLLLISKQEEAEEENLQYRFENPFLDNLREYSELGLKEKVVVLHHLCELRLDAPDISEKVKHLEGASLRVDPLGVDSCGTTYWYFYGTRLYKENYTVREKEEKKKRKKHKKRKKRKKSQDSVISSDEDQESYWSLACLTEEDWEQLALKYKYSDRREDRRLFRLLNDGFLPEIREMFGEKRKEEARKAKQQLSRRSSSRVEVLKKQQEENDRQLALKLAKQNSKAKKSARELRGRKRGRKRKHKESDNEEEEEGKEKQEEEQEEGEDSDEDEDSSEAQGDREERAKQREMMKEMRARREAEKLVESKFREEVRQQKANMKGAASNKKGRKRGRKSAKEKLEKAPRLERSERKKSSSSSSRDPSPDLSEQDSDDVYRPPKDYKSSTTRTIFSNALIRAGTKSTKDSSLEKEKQKSIKEIVEKPVVRKTPGLLLQSAGVGLLNKAKEKESPEETGDGLSTELSSFRRGSGISFGLWGGHLPVEQSIISSSLSSSYDDKPGDALLIEDKKAESAKKVFSNWGGDFFKKNLDFRANTNRILEKLTKSAGDEGNGVS